MRIKNMELSGEQREQLLDALIDAFPEKSKLKQMLDFKLNKNLNKIAGEGSLEDIVYELIRAATSQGWIEDLVRAAHQANPGNKKLKAFAQSLGVPIQEDKELQLNQVSSDTDLNQPDRDSFDTKNSENKQRLSFGTNSEIHPSQEFKKLQHASRCLNLFEKLALSKWSILLISIVALFGMREAKKHELNFLSSRAEYDFASGQQIESLVKALRLGRELEQWYSPIIHSDTKQQILSVLRKIVYSIQERNRLELHQDWVYCITFSKDGQILASGSEDKKIILWNRHGTKIKSFDNESPVRSLAFSPDGEVLISGDENNIIKLWSVHNQELPRKLPKQENPITSVDFSPSGKYFVSASGYNIVLWDRNGKLIKRFNQSHTQVINRVKFLDENIVVSASDDRTIRFWKIDGREIKILKDDFEIADVAFNLERKILASASRDKITIWNQNQQREETLSGHKSKIVTVNFSHSGEFLASADMEGRIIIWNINNFKPITNIKGHNQFISSVKFSPDDRIIASASEDNKIKIWSSDNQDTLILLKGHDENINEISFSSLEPKIASASNDNTVRIWNYNDKYNNKKDTVLWKHDDWVYSVTFNPTSRQIASGSKDKTVRLGNTQGNEPKILKKHTDEVRSVSFSPDGNILASASLDSQIILWDRNGNLIRDWKGNGDGVHQINFSPDGLKIISSHMDGTIKVWNLLGELQKSLSAGQTIRNVNFSPTGQMVASVDRTIKLWDSHFNSVSFPIPKQDSSVWSVSFSSDGEMISSVGTTSEDGNDVPITKIWDRHGNLLNNLRGHTETAFSVVFSPDNRLLASSGRDGSIILWYLTLDDLLDKGCNQILKDYLSTHPNINRDNYICKKNES